ncbi:unnamed protein product [Urochloa decumbens]|uniref:F-box domain-containing protein n=1 Tax=Urochloa decumbens TaxID=240449 RepID=A0ABC8Z8G9_9POAL
MLLICSTKKGTGDYTSSAMDASSEHEESRQQDLPDLAPVYDWSELPADLLIRIFVDLDVLDLFSVRAVCKSWWVYYLEARRLGPACCRSQSPCLLYSSNNHNDPNTATLFRLTNKKLYRVTLPDPPLPSCFVVGSCHGWLAIADEQSNLLLVNPLSRVQIALPPPLTIKNVRGCYTTDGILDRYHLLELDLLNQDCDTHADPYDDLTREQGRFYFYLRVAMSADPSRGSCIVMIMHMPNNHLSFARVGDAQWTWIDVNHRCRDYNDFFYNNSDGLFYAVRGSGEVHTIDLNGSSPVVKTILRPMVSYIDTNKYIVQAPWGDILQVWRDNDIDEEGEGRAIQLEVYMVDLVEQKLVEIKNLKEHTLFIGFNTPFFLLAEDYNMLIPDCIYLTDDYMDYIFCRRFNPRQVAVFSMKDGSFTDLFTSSDFWLNWPLPVWITPSYSQRQKRVVHV